MRKIRLKKLTLRNFKGIKNQEVSFTDLTNIKGDNGTGKTTIFDAFTWLLFEKDSNDRSAFEIKTLDSNNEVVHGLEHEVAGELEIEGKKYILKKIFREKWTKKKGEADRQFTGHETVYYINDVPMKQGEYKETIEKFVTDQLFKLTSSPLYFSTNMKWQDRRNVVMEIIGDIAAERIFNYKQELVPLAPYLQDTTIEDLKRTITARKKRLNENIKAIPIRIDELNNSLQEIDFSDLDYEIKRYTESLKSIEEALLDTSKVNGEYFKDKNRLYEFVQKLRDMEFDAKNKADNQRRVLQDKLRNLEYDIQNAKSLLTEVSSRRDNYLDNVKQLELINESLKNKWYEINAKELVFDENKFICPTCHRTFDEEDIEAKKTELAENFRKEKISSQKKITEEGKANGVKIAEYQKNAEQSDNKINSLKETITSLENEKASAEEEMNGSPQEVNLEFDSDYMDLKNQIAELELKLSKPMEQSEEVNALKAQYVEYTKKLDELKKAAGVKEMNERTKVRIKELTEEEKLLAKQIAELESQEMLCEEYTKTKVELLEFSINNKFKYVKFKLFNTLINGAVEDCCEALINGVPFSNANKASQINGGLDIINALCRHYGVQVPIFIDNRESINEILDCDSQIINLVVSNDKTLVVEGLEKDNEENYVEVAERNANQGNPEPAKKESDNQSIEEKNWVKEDDPEDGPGF